MRDEQHHSIVQSLLASDWIQVDHELGCFVDPFLTTDVPRLQRVGEEFYINLWPAGHYRLPVDGDLCEVPHICAWNHVLVETKFFPNPSHSDRSPRVLSDGIAVYLPAHPDQSPDRPCRTPVYIPTIPRYLDACLSRSRHYFAIRSSVRPSDVFFSNSASLEIGNLIRYLYLEMEDQRAKLLTTTFRTEPRGNGEKVNTVRKDLQNLAPNGEQRLGSRKESRKVQEN